MAKKNSTAHSELKITVHGNWVTYEGTKEQLINEGVCDDVVFPEGNKRQNSHHEPGSANNKDWMINKIKGGRFELRRGTYNGEFIRTRPRPESYNSIETWLESQKRSSKMSLGSIYANFSGDCEELNHGGVTIKSPQKQLKELTAALLKVDELIDEMTAIRTSPKITEAKQDDKFQSMLNSVLEAK